MNDFDNSRVEGDLKTLAAQAMAANKAEQAELERWSSVLCIVLAVVVSCGLIYAASMLPIEGWG